MDSSPTPIPSLDAERAFLDRVYATYTVDRSAQTRAMRSLIMRTIRPYLRRGHGLELGCSDGFMTALIAAELHHLDVVDGSKSFLAAARSRALQNVTFNYSLFEEFVPRRQYDYIFASYILEHVIDPLAVLRMARGALARDGLLFVVVPNARSLSRQLALRMGLIADLKALTQNDIDHGHRRVFDRAYLDHDLESAGFETVAQGGIMLKILADFQMDRLIDDGTLSEQHVEGLYRLGLEHPNLCGSLFSVCRARS